MKKVIFYTVLMLLMVSCSNDKTTENSTDNKLQRDRNAEVRNDKAKGVNRKEIKVEDAERKMKKKKVAEEAKKTAKKNSKYSDDCDSILTALRGIVDRIKLDPDSDDSWDEFDELDNDIYTQECLKRTKNFRSEYDSISAELEEL